MDEQLNQSAASTSKFSQLQNLAIPIAIVIAGGLISVALYMSAGKSSMPMAGNQPSPTPSAQPAPKGNLDAIAPVTGADHIRGNPDAPIKIVEYSDFECPFCKVIHQTMQKVMDEYGESGEVAWVFRQFPLEQLHPVKAQAVAVASECAAKLGGEEAFWKFADGYFAVTLTNNRTDIETVIPKIIRDLGLSEAEFQKCFTSGEFDDRIKAQVEDAVATGGSGTPWSILVTADGRKFPINGAQPYEAIKQLIELAKKPQ